MPLTITLYAPPLSSSATKRERAIYIENYLKRIENEPLTSPANPSWFRFDFYHQKPFEVVFTIGSEMKIFDWNIDNQCWDLRQY